MGPIWMSFFGNLLWGNLTYILEDERLEPTNHPWKERNIIWSKAPWLCYMLIFRSVPCKWKTKQRTEKTWMIHVPDSRSYQAKFGRFELPGYMILIDDLLDMDSLDHFFLLAKIHHVWTGTLKNLSINKNTFGTQRYRGFRVSARQVSDFGLHHGSPSPGCRHSFEWSAIWTFQAIGPRYNQVPSLKLT